MKNIFMASLLLLAVLVLGRATPAKAQEAAVEPIVKCEIDEIPVDRDKDGDTDFCVQCLYVKCTEEEIEVIDPWGCVRACRPAKSK